LGERALNNPSYVKRCHLALGNGQRVGGSQKRVQWRGRLVVLPRGRLIKTIDPAGVLSATKKKTSAV